MNYFNDPDKIFVRLTINGHGKEHVFNADYDDCIMWSEVLDDVIKTMEASWGYSFDLDIERPEYGKLGIYYKAKDASVDE
jgi:hypothetical protein